jgi:hypothetical protein
MTLKELLAEKGQAYIDGILLDTDDVRHLANYNGETHGEMIRVLEEFYEEYYHQVHAAQLEMFIEFLEEKEKESNGLN